MTRLIPEVGEHDAERILRRDYPEADLEETWLQITRLELREEWRVVLACLKIAVGSVAGLR